MPYLGDYLGQILSEISIARMQSDLESVRIAELYATHPLLKTLPVPHVRLPDVEIDLPVLIKASEDLKSESSARGGVKIEDVSRRFISVLTSQLSEENITLSTAEHKNLRLEITKRLASFKIPAEISIDVLRIADDLTATAARVIPDLAQIDYSQNILSKLRENARLELLRLRAQPPRLSVIVTSGEIREAGNSENVARFKLKISEQGFEWKTIELNGIQQDRLIPE
jgi:hypothetical protein